MVSSLFTKSSSTALQIKDHVIRYVSAKKPTISTVRGFSEFRLPKGIIERGKIVDLPAFDKIIGKCVKKWNLKNKEIKFFVPDAFLFFRKLTVPGDLPDEEVRGYLNFEIGTNIHLPFEDAYFDFHFLNEDTMEEGEEREILFFATPEPLIKEYQAVLERHKLKPILADVPALCINQLLTVLGYYEPNEHYLFVEWDMTSINLSIFREEIPVFMRHLPLSMEDADWEEGIVDGIPTMICQNEDKIIMEITDQIAEIERVMNFYKYSLQQGESEVTSIVLVGDHSMLATIKERLSQYDARLISLDERELGFHYHKLGIRSKYMLPLSLCLKEV